MMDAMHQLNTHLNEMHDKLRAYSELSGFNRFVQPMVTAALTTNALSENLRKISDFVGVVFVELRETIRRLTLTDSADLATVIRTVTTAITELITSLRQAVNSNTTPEDSPRAREVLAKVEAIQTKLRSGLALFTRVNGIVGELRTAFSVLSEHNAQRAIDSFLQAIESLKGFLLEVESQWRFSIPGLQSLLSAAENALKFSRTLLNSLPAGLLTPPVADGRTPLAANGWYPRNTSSGNTFNKPALSELEALG